MVVVVSMAYMLHNNGGFSLTESILTVRLVLKNRLVQDYLFPNSVDGCCILLGHALFTYQLK